MLTAVEKGMVADQTAYKENTTGRERKAQQDGFGALQFARVEAPGDERVTL